MASSPLITKTSYHARSISLPSRPHPVTEQFEEQLCRLRSSQTASTSSVSHRLSIVVDLYGCVDELLVLPSNQQAIAENRQANCVDDMLDGSLKLLDICGTARDALLVTRESIHKIQSILRRRCSGELSVGNEIDEYLSARKKAKKAIKICLKDIKKVDQSGETSVIFGMLKEVEAVTVDILKSSLIHIAGSEISKKSNWSMVSKFVHRKGDKEEATSPSGLKDLDAAFSSLVSQKKKAGINMMQVDNLRVQMEKMESEIQDLDEAFESLFRHLVKSRATLLNILSN